jgi:hypothetical protein
MSFIKNLGGELGTGVGKGIVGLIAIAGKILWVCLTWLCDWKQNGKEPALRTNSLRMAAWSILLSIFLIPGLVTFNGTGNKAEDNNSEKSTSNETIPVSVQLREGEMPILPLAENFRTLPDGDTRYYVLIENKKYFLYMEPSKLGDISKALVMDSSCYIVPAGRMLEFYTVQRPLIAINMERTLMRRLKNEANPYLLRILLSIKEMVAGKSLVAIREYSWKATFNSWEDSHPVHENFTLLTVKAMSKEDIPGGAPGGLVCF